MKQNQLTWQPIRVPAIRPKSDSIKAELAELGEGVEQLLSDRKSLDGERRALLDTETHELSPKHFAAAPKLRGRIVELLQREMRIRLAICDLCRAYPPERAEQLREANEAVPQAEIKVAKLLEKAGFNAPTGRGLEMGVWTRHMIMAHPAVIEAKMAIRRAEQPEVHRIISQEKLAIEAIELELNRFRLSLVEV